MRNAMMNSTIPFKRKKLPIHFKCPNGLWTSGPQWRYLSPFVPYAKISEGRKSLNMNLVTSNATENILHASSLFLPQNLSFWKTWSSIWTIKIEKKVKLSIDHTLSKKKDVFSSNFSAWYLNKLFFIVFWNQLLFFLSLLMFFLLH